MIFGFITFLTALTISAVAIYYSVAGLAAIFAAAVIPIIVMGVSLEVGKLVTAVWLHRYWSQATWWLKTYLSIAVFVLMFITSMGIFGFLSKAHIEQTSMSQEQVALIETLDDKQNRATAKITRWQDELDRLMKGQDVRVDNLIDRENDALKDLYAQIEKEKENVRADAQAQIKLQNDRLEQAKLRKESDIKAAKDRFEGSLGGGTKYDEAVEKAKSNELSVASSAQKEIRKINTTLTTSLEAVDTKYADSIKAINDRIQVLRNQANTKTVDIDSRVNELEGFIEAEQVKIDDVREEKFVYEKEYRKLEAEVGPIKYIAEFVYGENADNNLLEEAVRWVIIVIIFVFDPLAVLLLIASQYTFNWARENKNGGGSPGKFEPKSNPNSPTPGYTKEEWDEAHRQNYEFDRAKAIDTNEPPEIDLVQPEPEEPKQQTLHEMAMEGFKEEQEQRAIEERNEEWAEMYAQADNAQPIKEEPLPPEVDDLDKWNDWVEKANNEAEKNPEEVDENNDGIDDNTGQPITGIVPTKGTFAEAEALQKKTLDGINYMKKEGNKQVRKTSTPK
tara:strand:- start:3066 stop:4751 length:1686 start_codon:yes stop_codon:yes gene_type:complete